MNTLKEFGDTAKGLAKNPLGIIALFIVLIYGFASLVVGFSPDLQQGDRTPLIWFLVLFPVAVLIVFAWLVSNHHAKLYAPGDFKDEQNFLESRQPELAALEFARPEPVADIGVTTGEEVPDAGTPEGRARERQEIYSENREYFIAHVIEPSKEEGQEYDIFIYLIRHKSADFGDLERTEFFFGHYWGNRIFEGRKVGRFIGVRRSAYGPFLCTCGLTFRDGGTASVHRYIDFEMGNLLKNRKTND